jgi:hypothetical protein
MRIVSITLAGAAVAVAVMVSGCGMIAPHIDCDQVAQQQRSGVSDTEIAQQAGFTVADVQSCSQTASSGGRERESNYSEQPRLPVIPNINSGSIAPSSIGGIGGMH